MKKIAAWLLVAFLTLMIAGCGPDPADPEPPDSPEPPEEVGVEYDKIDDLGELPQDVQNVMPFLKKERGYFVFSPEEYEELEKKVFAVFAGEKPTGGYELLIDSVEAEDGTLQVFIEEIEPGPDDHVTQALTYPLAALFLEGDWDEYQAVSTENESFEPISPDVIPEFKEAEGVYQGLQDSSSAEIIVDGEPMALRFMEYFSAFDELLNFGDDVFITYYVNEHEQNILVDIDTAERANMVRGVEGVFEGQIDSQSVEITVDGEPRAFVPAEQILIDQFHTGDRVILDYYEASNGRLILSRMEMQ